MASGSLNSMKTVTVYWTPWSLPERNFSMNLLWDPPTPLLKTLPGVQDLKNSSISYLACKSAQKLFKNTYTTSHPLSVTATLTGSIENPVIESTHDVWIPRNAPLNNSYSIDYDFGWLFFCEESLELRLTQPYMHQVESAKTSFLSSGSFDIGKWFRPCNLAYILWPNQNTLSFKKGDIVAYFEFNTNKKIVLKQFNLTPELFSMAAQTVEFKKAMPNQGLTELYERFTRGNLNKLVLKHIKNNLIE